MSTKDNKHSQAPSEVTDIDVMTWGGIGDILLLTPALRALKQKHQTSRLRVFCSQASHFQVLEHNPHIDVLRIYQGGWNLTALGRPVVFYRWLRHQVMGPRRRDRRRFYLPQYGNLQPTLLRNRHATELIGELLGVEVRDRTLEVFLTQSEEAKGKAIATRYKNPIAMHITSTCCENQNWRAENWDALVARNPQYTFLQLGLKDETAVRGTVDLRGTLTLRESFAVLKFADAFVGVVSSMAHATNALGTKGVVLFGPSAPEVWAHPNNITLTKNLRCAPCVDYLVGVECPYGAPCLSEITIEEVECALRKHTRAVAPSTLHV
jgi:ADP-heptose:LPS heptosyltransferase